MKSDVISQKDHVYRVRLKNNNPPTMPSNQNRLETNISPNINKNTVSTPLTST
jgi:hypothetical protein